MFFGFVGLLDAFLLLPLLVCWDYLGIEEFEWPPIPSVWTLLLINGFVGTVLSELLWLWSVSAVSVNCYIVKYGYVSLVMWTALAL